MSKRLCVVCATEDDGRKLYIFKYLITPRVWRHIEPCESPVQTAIDNAESQDIR